MSNDTFYIAATGLRTQERALSLTAGNITNMNTAGYKRSQVRYAELLSPSVSSNGLLAPTAARSAGVSLAGTTTVLTPGDLRATGSAMDVAIEGDGFIELLGPEGQSLLWRGGTLAVGPDGLLSTLDGYPLRAFIQVPEDLTQFTITRDGTVWGQSADSQSPIELGRIDLVLPARPETLNRSEGGYYAVNPEQRLDMAVPGEGRAGLAGSGRRGSLQRRAGRRDGDPDAGPARLRCQRPGPAGRGSTHGDRQRPASLIMLAVCMTIGLAGTLPSAPVELRDQVQVEGPFVTLGDVADLSVLPTSIRSKAEAIRVVHMNGPHQSVSALVIASRARSTLPALAPWFCEIEDKAISLYRSESRQDEDETVFRRGQSLTLTVTVGRVAVERDVWALQDGRGSGSIFVRTADGDVLRVEGSELR